MRSDRRLSRDLGLERLESRRLLTVITVLPQPIAIQTPHINALLRRSVGGAALTDGNGNFSIDALFNTASPGILLSNETADFLGVQREQVNSANAVFAHNSSGGPINFNVSESLDMSLASYNPFVDPNSLASYTRDSGLKYMEIGPAPADPNLASLDMVGPEAVAGNVVVMDPKPANTFADTFRTYIYPPGTAYNSDSIDDPGIPPVSNHVQLSYGDYTRFPTNVSGAANVPNEHTLMFVGPNPINPTPPDDTPPVSFALGANNGTGSFLLDTAAATSMISLAKAASLGVTYKAGTFNTSDAALVGIPTSQQFRLAVQSLAGQVTLAGFFADSLTLQSDAGPIVFNHVPLLVGDAAIGANSGVHQTLDGVLGMNLFGASAALDAKGKVDQQTPGAFNWITLDEGAKTLGLQIASSENHPHVVSSSFNSAGTQQSITMVFSGETSGPTGSDLTLTNQVTGQPVNVTINASYNAVTHTATFTFPNLPDGNYTASLFSGAVLNDNGQGLGDDFTLAFWTYRGDANHDRTVNALDFNALATGFGKPNQGFANGDFNYDGAVNTSDFALLAGRFNQFFTGPDAPATLLAPASVLAAPTGVAAPAPVVRSLFNDKPLRNFDASLL
jgi:dockerin type I repeat protein